MKRLRDKIIAGPILRKIDKIIDYAWQGGVGGAEVFY